MTQDPALRDGESRGAALARLYDLDLLDDPGDLDLYLALAARAGDPIVELAVGSGRIAVPLAAAGHAVVGIDHDPAMLARARARWSEAHDATRDRNGPSVGPELVEGDVLAPGMADIGRFRLAILALNSLLLFPDARRQAGVIEVMAKAVAPGGLVVVDAWQPTPADLVALDGRLSLEWLRVDPASGREVTKVASGWYDSATGVVSLTTVFEEADAGGPVVRWTRSDRMRLTTAEELERWAETAGLEVEQIAGDYELSAYGPSSERAILVARRPDR